MKDEANKILQDLKDDIDKKNLDNLVRLSEKRQNPEAYNENIIKYDEEIALYAGLRALKSPIETFYDFFLNLNKLLTF